jgi:hypothetical protein
MIRLSSSRSSSAGKSGEDAFAGSDALMRAERGISAPSLTSCWCGEGVRALASGAAVPPVRPGLQNGCDPRQCPMSARRDGPSAPAAASLGWVGFRSRLPARRPIAPPTRQGRQAPRFAGRRMACAPPACRGQGRPSVRPRPLRADPRRVKGDPFGFPRPCSALCHSTRPGGSNVRRTGSLAHLRGAGATYRPHAERRTHVRLAARLAETLVEPNRRTCERAGPDRNCRRPAAHDGRRRTKKRCRAGERDRQTRHSTVRRSTHLPSSSRSPIAASTTSGRAARVP